MRKFFILLFFLNVAFIGIAQNNLPPVSEIKTDTAEYFNLNDSNWQMLEDRTGKLTIDQVSQPPIANQFHTNIVSAEGVNIYWFRYCVKNVMTQKIEVGIPTKSPYADVYTRDSTGRWDHKMTGYYVPWSKRDDLKRIESLLYTIQPGEQLLVYERESGLIPTHHRRVFILIFT